MASPPTAIRLVTVLLLTLGGAWIAALAARACPPGDAPGALALAPWALLLAIPSAAAALWARARYRPRLPLRTLLGTHRLVAGLAAIVIVAGSSLALAAGVRLRRAHEARVDAEFRRVVDRVEDELEDRVRDVFTPLRGLHALLLANPGTTGAMFETFIRTRLVDGDVPGVLAAAALPLASRTPAGTGAGGAHAPYGWPAGPGDALASFCADGHPAVEAARRHSLPNDRIALTCPVHIEGIAGGRPVILGLMAVDGDAAHKPGAGASTDGALAVIAIDPSVVLASVAEEAAVTVDDGGDPIFRSGTDGETPGSNRLRHRLSVPVAGRDWTVEAWPTAAFTAESHTAAIWLVPALGLLLSAAAGATVWTLGTSRESALALARAMSADSERARLAAENALRETAAMRHAVGAHAIVAVTDPAGRIIDVNDAFCRISGYSRDELLGRTHAIVNSHHHPRAFWTDLWRTISQGRIWHGNICNRRKDGSLYWVDTTIVPVLDGDGRVERHVAMRTDITEHKALEQRLAEATEQARQASRAKGEFLANMSHEIRTPLTSILGFVDLLRDDHERLARGERLRILTTMRAAGEHLLAILNDVLDLSKIEAGRMTIETASTDLVELLGCVRALTARAADEKGLEFHVVLETPIPRRVLTDPTRLRQILVNIVGNAVKFTARGRVTVRVQARTSDDGTTLTVLVEDTGPGLTASQSRALFRPFTQADSSVTRDHGGTGLGLAISRRLAGLLGGQVWLERTSPGAGACFGVRVRVAPEPGSPWTSDLSTLPPAPEAPQLGVRLAGRVLVAEDGPDNQRLIRHFLTAAGAEVEVASNGRVALEMLQAAKDEGRPFALLVTDVQMPEMDGYSLARLVRARRDPIPILALTAHAMAEDRARCLAAGCSDYATKPIDRAALVAICARWMARAEPHDARTAA